MNKFLETPFNYAGNKYKLLNKILPYFPKNCNTFYDVFGGGVTVSLNYNNAKNYKVSDINTYMIMFCNFLKITPKEKIFKDILNIINTFGFSKTFENEKEFFILNNKKIAKDGKQNNGLDEYNKKPYELLRKEFNSLIKNNGDKYFLSLYFYVLVVHSYNYQFRFNSSGFFNMPCGRGDWNLKMQKKLSDFIDVVQKREIEFNLMPFQSLNCEEIKNDDFVYLDPPYLITTASYNENNGWNEENEKELLTFIEKLIKKNVKFILSNVIEHKGRENILLKNFVNNNHLTMINMEHEYKSHGAKRKNTSEKTIEVIVKNF